MLACTTSQFIVVKMKHMLHDVCSEAKYSGMHLVMSLFRLEVDLYQCVCQPVIDEEVFITE